MTERLQKLLARAGFGSRRSVEAIITAGRVRVNGQLVQQLGAKADSERDVVEVDGTRIDARVSWVYLAMNKPDGYVTTARDPQGRRTVMDLLPYGIPKHVLPIGRLDANTEGLLLFTNDGEFAHRVAHPRYTIDKEYRALVKGVPSSEAMRLLRTGLEIDGRITAPAEAAIDEPPPGYPDLEGHAWLRLVIHEGHKRQVRLMCTAVGHPVRTLVRVRIGPVILGRLARGKTRPLTRAEVSAVRESVGLAPDRQL